MSATKFRTLVSNVIFEGIVGSSRAGAISIEGDNELIVLYSSFSFIECTYKERCGGSICKDKSSVVCKHVCFVHNEAKSGNNQGGSVLLAINSSVLFESCLCLFSSARELSTAADSTLFVLSQPKFDIVSSNFTKNNGSSDWGNCLLETWYGVGLLIKNSDVVNCSGLRFALFDMLKTPSYVQNCNILENKFDYFFIDTEQKTTVSESAIFGCSKKMCNNTFFLNCWSDDPLLSSFVSRTKTVNNNNHAIVCLNIRLEFSIVTKKLLRNLGIISFFLML